MTRLSVNINQETEAFLRAYARRHGCTITEALRRAVGVSAFVQAETDSGRQVLVGGRRVVIP